MVNLNEILKNYKGEKILMTVFPHPDDEAMATGGLILVAKSLGWKVVTVTLTYGEAGKIYVNGSGKSVREIRKYEFKKALEILKVDCYDQGDFGDAKLKANIAEWSEWLEMVIKRYQPSLVVTYDHTGFTGHPDHIVLSVELKKVISEKFPEIGLFWSVVPKYLKRVIGDAYLSDYEVEPDNLLDLGHLWFTKWRAAKAYKSQKLGKSFPVFLFIFFLFYHFEWYHKVSLSIKYKYKFIDFVI